MVINTFLYIIQIQAIFIIKNLYKDQSYHIIVTLLDVFIVFHLFKISIHLDKNIAFQKFTIKKKINEICFK